MQGIREKKGKVSPSQLATQEQCIQHHRIQGWSSGRYHRGWDVYYKTVYHLLPLEISCKGGSLFITPV